MSLEGNRRIALALSGGGIRAMVFHLGVLKFLAERCLLEEIQRVSTVSGGSLLVGLLLKETGMHWPSSEEFLTAAFPQLRDKLCELSLQWAAARQLLNPLNWRFILSRANLLGLALRAEWGIDSKLSDLPSTPEWSINGTTAESGKRFRFKRDNLGDYTLGYAAGAGFPLADALAVSAAFPGGFGPLRIDAKKFDWRKRPWGAQPGTEKSVDIGFDALHLYDGGVYDNLGLEPYFDCGKCETKHPDNYIIVSDAGSPLPSGFSFRQLNPRRLKRIADIMSDQSHALRVRAFANYLQQRPERGAFIFINTPTDDLDNSASFASGFPTTLRKLSFSDFDRLAGHGYKVAVQVERQYGLCKRLPGQELATSSRTC
ncbi:MAG TPA: patatin-like phospholipase family protein [Nitrospira sp.]|nr:patatin-like phospholipase family protein [Nitrospira sp.]HNP41143.1 patatin-like phospholipase family protein [Nitrospira sp.]